MKTLSRVFTVWCWCLCITAFGFAKEAVTTQQEVFQQNNTPEEQNIQSDIEKKEELEAERNKKVAPAHTHDHEGDCEEASPRKVNVEDAYKVLELTPAQIAAKEAHRLAKENANPINISIYSVENEAHLKGYDTLEEYIQAVNADRESISKEGAVSYEAYLQGLEAKEQATPLEYNLQAVENAEGTIVTNPQADKKISK